MKFNLPDIEYISEWDEYSITKMLYKEFNSYEDITEDIDLYQNTCDGRNYKLRTIPKERCVHLYRKAFDDNY